MKTQQRNALAYALAALAVVGTASAFEQRDLLPVEAAMVVRLSSAPGVLQAVDASPLGCLWRDRQMQAFMGEPPTGEALLRHILSSGDEESDDAEKEIAELEYAMLRMISGELVVAVDPSAQEDDAWIVATIPRADYERSLAMDRRIAELKHGTMTIVRSRFMEQDIYAFTETEEGDEVDGADAKAETKIRRNWQCHVGQTLVSGPNEEWVKASVARLLKETPREPAGAPEVTIRIDVPGLISAAAKEEAENRNRLRESLAQHNPSAAARLADRPQMSAMLKALGLGDVGVLDLRLVLHPTMCQFDVALPIGESRSGVLALFDATPSSTALRVPFVSDRTVSYSVGRLDLRAFWKALPSLFAQIAPNPQQQAFFEAMLVQITTFLGIDPDTDLLAHLGTQMVSASSISNDEIMQVVGFELRNEAAFRASLDKLFAEGSQVRALLGTSLKEERIGEHTFYIIGETPSVEETEDEEDDGDDAAPEGAVAVAGGFVLSGDEAAVRGALQSLATPEQAARFYSGPLFQRLQRTVPTTACGYEILDFARIVRAVLSALAADAEGMLGTVIAEGIESFGFKGSPDPGRLPPFSHVTSFFGPVVTATDLRDGRISIQVQGFYPEAR